MTSNYFKLSKWTGALRRSDCHHTGTTQEKPKFWCCPATTANKALLLLVLLAAGLDAKLDSVIVSAALELPRTDSYQDAGDKG